MNRVSTTKGKRTALRWIGETQIQRHDRTKEKDHTPDVVIHNQKDHKDTDPLSEE